MPVGLLAPWKLTISCLAAASASTCSYQSMVAMASLFMKSIFTPTIAFTPSSAFLASIQSKKAVRLAASSRLVQRFHSQTRRFLLMAYRKR